MAANYQPPQWLVPNMGPGNISKVGNYSLNLDRVGDVINLGASSLIGGRAALSVSVWFNTTDGTNAQYMTGAYAGGTGSLQKTFGVQIDVNASDTIKIIQSNQTGTNNANVAFDPVLAINTWYHLVVLYDGAGATNTDKIKVYLNNALLTSSSENGTIAATIFPFSDSDANPYLWLGSSGYNVNPPTLSLFDGELSELSYFDYVLSTDNITTLYGDSTNGVGNPMALASPPIGYWRGDKAGFGSQWALPNQVNYDQVFEFDGSSDYITTSYSTSAGNKSLSLWFKSSASGYTVLLGDTTSALSLGDTSGDWADESMGFYSTTAGGGSTSILMVVRNGHTAYLDGNWHHAVIVYNGTTKLVYIDGVSQTVTYRTTAGWGDATTDINLTNLLIGDSVLANTMEGDLSNIAVFNSALPATGTESIEALYNNGTPNQNIGSWSNLQGWWKLNGNNSTFNGSDWEIENNAITPNYTTALALDQASNNRIDLTSGFAIGTNKTVSFWFSPNNTGSVNGILLGGSAQYYPSITGMTNPDIRLYDGTTVRTFASTLTLEYGVWYHLAITADGTTATIYWNGESIGTVDDITPASLNTLGAYSGGSFNIGANISNFAYWNTELSAGNITTLYNNGTPAADISGLSPVGWWKLDNLTTGLQDGGSGGNNGVNNNAVEITTYPVTTNGISDSMTQANLVSTTLARSSSDSNYSFNFDGVDDYIDLGNNDFGLAYNQPLSVSVWVNIGIAGTDCVISKRESSGAYMGWSLRVNITGEFMFLFSENGFTKYINTTSTTQLIASTWYHLVATYDGSVTTGGFKLYLNGVAETVSSASAGTVTTFANSTVASIGARGAANLFFDGNISNPAIWDSELSAANITTLYNNGRPGDLSSFSPAPVSWWKLGDNAFATKASSTAWTIPDQIGSNDGTSAGNPNISGEAPGSSNNGLSLNMNLNDRTGESGHSVNNAQSYNMATTTRIAYT